MKNFNLIITLFFPVFLFSQTGPGGVGSNDGASNLEAWYLPESGITNLSGTQIWKDGSGNGLNLTQNISSLKPHEIFGVLNGYPVLRFVPNSFLSTLSSGLLQAKNNYTIFIVGYANAASQRFLEFGDITTDGMAIKSAAANSIEHIHNSIASAGTDVFNAFDGQRSNTTAQIITILRSGAGAATGYQKIINQMSHSGALATESPLFNPGVFQVGGVSGGVSFVGDIAEVIVYDRELNGLEKLIVENYLSAKYNITIVKEDYYDEDDPANGDYDFDVAGIGRLNATEIHNNSQGTGVFAMLNPQNLDDNEYCIWGHDGATILPTEIIDIPATVTSRSERIWRASEVDNLGNSVDVGAVDIRFDLTGISIATSQLRLLVDTDNDGIFADETPLTGATLVSPNIYQFAGVTALQNNLRFTAGFVGSVSLPIELISFDVKQKENNTIELNWQTATEINNDYFTIERSDDAKVFSPIKTIKGAGNSNALLSYAVLDIPQESTEAATFYYRLKQTDFDGKYTYSTIKSVSLGVNFKPSVEVYPNPTTNQLTINASTAEMEQPQLFNILGENVTDKVIFVRNTKETTASLNNLKQGVYYLKTKTTTTKVIKK